MRIGVRARISIGLSILVAALVGLALLLGMRATDHAMELSKRSTEMLNKVFQLSMLTTDYLVDYEPRAERQWAATYRDIDVLLDSIDASHPEDRDIVARVRDSLEQARSAFLEITAAHSNRDSGTVDAAVSVEYEARMTSRLLVLMQQMVSDAVALGNHASTEAGRVQRLSMAVALGISLIGAAMMLGIGFTAERAIVRPLESLQATAARVGAGELDVRSNMTAEDEVGDFARAFDGMIEALQQSHEMLEAEVSERRRVEEALSEYRDHLEQLVDDRTTELVAVNEDLTRATRAKDDFFAAMSHELRTPLNSIIGFTDLMRKGLAGEITLEQRRQLDMVHHSGQQLLTIVNELLELSRINAGKLSVAVMPLSPSVTVNRLVEMMRPLAMERDIELGAAIDADAPAQIRSDEGKIEQILMNLLSNAIKFTPGGRVDVKVHSVGSGEVEFEVRDTGSGIPVDELDRIFEHFHQVRPDRTDEHPGTGLGLPIARQLAEALGGTLTVASAVGFGSTFRLTIPADLPESCR